MPLVVLAGPPLPGRWSLARTLHERLVHRRFTVDEPGSVPRLEVEHALTDGACVLVDGDLATRVERQQILALGGPARDRLLVEWRCGKQQAEREIFHRYAKRPKVLARDEFRRYLRDARVRQPIVDEVSPEQVVHVEAGMPVDDAVAAIADRLRLPELPPRERNGARRVMIVEDDSDERAMLAEVLRELGFAVEIAPDAGVAMALLDDGVDVDLLISDQRMPGMTGTELSDELTRRHPDVRTVLVTAYGDADTCRAAVQAHAVTVLAKPLSVMDLERVLEEAIV
ncbi:MAG TPA: response regulator [Polyangia bacterium]|jgi:CheY-like chemotaxis protein|nr:response regulator [Polyangia bacterium]